MKYYINLFLELIKTRFVGGRSTTGVQNDNDTITQRLFNAFIGNVVYVMKLDDHAGRSKH